MTTKDERIGIDYLDPQLQKAIRRAEKADGRRYGPQFLDGKPCFVTITFAPKRRWWLLTEGDQRLPLDDETAQRLQPLKL